MDHQDDKMPNLAKENENSVKSESGKGKDESSILSCGASASAVAKKRERRKRKERELKAKLIALQQTSDIEKKLRTLKREHELEQAEQELRRAREKAENLRKSQLLKEEEAQLERKRAAINLQVELRLLQEEELDAEKDDADYFYDEGQEQEETLHGQQSQELHHPAFTDPPRTSDGHQFLSPQQPQTEITAQATVASKRDEIWQQPNSNLKKEKEIPVIRQHEMNRAEGVIPQVINEMMKFTAQNSLPAPELEPFSGDPLNFLTFIRNFEYVVESKTDDPARKLELLLKYTKGEARELIRECPHIQPSQRAFETAKYMLGREYGQPTSIANAYKEKARAWEQIRTGDGQALRKFAIFLNNCSHVKAAGDMGQMDGVGFLRILAGKLPLYLQQKWITRVGFTRDITNRNPTLDDLAQFVTQIARNQNDPMVVGLGYQRTERSTSNQANNPRIRPSGPKNAAKAFGVNTSQQSQEHKTQKPPSCSFCGIDTKHVIDDCRKFKALSVDERSEQCRRKGLCFRCLKPRHRKKECRSQVKCDLCRRMHHSLMHDPRRMQGNEGETRKHTNEMSTSTDVHTEAVKVSSGSTNVKKGKGKTQQPTACMTIVPVVVKQKESDQCISTYAYLDNGCGTVFCDSELTQRLHARTRKTKLIIKTLNLEEVIDTEVTVDELEIAGIKEMEFISLPPAYIQDSIPVTVSDAATQTDLKTWKHLQDIVLPELSGRNTIPRVTLMIGTNVPSATMPLEIQVGNEGEPYAIRSKLGWLVYGIHSQVQADSHRVCFCKQQEVTVIPRQDDLEQKFKEFCNMEFTERLSETREGLSVDDKHFLEIMDQSTTKQGQHYQMDLPFRQTEVTMPSNKGQAKGFIERLGQKLSKNDEMRQQYTTFMNNLEKQGFAERVPEAELNRDDGKVWYIPHHGVYHPRKPGKIRVVFNCPISYKGRSLNQELLQGPDLTNRLFGVLLRWRKEEVAIMADIESMFYQVRVTPEQCDMLRYWWWPDGDLNKEPMEYRMLVHLFGAVSSPSCSNYALKRTAKDNQGCASQEVIDAIQDDFYVDDFLKSVQTREEGIALAKEMRQVLTKGGFKLTKWSSNSRQVLDSIPKEDHAVEIKNLDLTQETLPTERALGVRWEQESDELGFKLKEMSRRATRRNILSVMSSVYDPFGFAAPYVLKAKMILQELCQAKIDWDQSIPEKQRLEWENWMNELQGLDQLKVDRCVKPKNFGKIVNTQLHHFADASKDGYGVVTYLRQTNEDEEVHVAFLSGKARVAPLKPHTIVKMELTAATLAVKQDNMIQREMKMDLDKTVFWTDSQTVLKYIANETARYPVFVTNRLSVIRDGSNSEQWKYIPTKLNPADHASRGLDANELTRKEEWLKGPEFLRQSEEMWPSFDVKTSKEDGQVDETQSEEIEEIHTHAVNTYQENPINALLLHYSDWNKLRRAVAWILKVKKRLQEKVKGMDGDSNGMFNLTNEDIEDAEVAIIQQVQLQSYPKEMKLLTGDSDGKELPKNSSISNLDPELSDGLLRVGGRLQNAQIPSSAKHQYILPRKHHITTLLIEDIHRRVGHQGQNHMVAELRQKYWVVGAGVVARYIARKCFICRKNRAKVGHQMMAELPRSRVQGEEPAFTRVGMDYFGPFEIKCGRSIRKRYGVIFTCMTSRAIHIELASSLETSSCIDAIRRFISRRGPVKEMFSDNGTNLVGAENELRQALKELNQDQIIHFHAIHGMKWNFNPPAASHQGGVWERQIRTIRKVLRAILTEQYLKSSQNEEQLHTLMCEVEAIINSRPLTRCSDNPNDLDVISPNSLLTMKASTTLPPGIFDAKDVYARRRWKQMQYLADLFWKRWVREYLPSLQQRQKWLQPGRNLQVGDIVLIADEAAPRCSWSMARVQEVLPDKKGFVRRAKVKTATTVLTRPVTKLCLLLEQETGMVSSAN